MAALVAAVGAVRARRGAVVAALLAAVGAVRARRGAVVAALLAAVAVAAVCPGAAAGQGEPSAEQLWQQYPLRQPTPSATPRPSRTVAATPAAADDPGPAGGGVEVVLVLVVLAGLVAGGVLVVRRRPPEPPPSERAPMTPPATRRRPPSSAPLRAVGRLAAAPPDPLAGWEAEIAWDSGAGIGRFRAVATPADGGPRSEVGRSRTLRWPPSGPADIADLTRAAEELESALLDAGWTSPTAGDEWYAKHFSWIPAAAPGPDPHARRPPAPEAEGQPPPAPGPALAIGRFWRAEPWPADTESLWRCEVRWSAGWVTSRFEAVAMPPGERRGKPVAATEPIKWMLKADPDPEGADARAALAQLVRELLAAGWEREGRGRQWFAQRFSWPREGDPPAAATASHEERA